MQRDGLAKQDISSLKDAISTAEVDEKVIAEDDAKAIAEVMNAINDASEYFDQYLSLDNYKEIQKNNEALMQRCHFILTRRYQNDPPSIIKNELAKINFYMGYAKYCDYDFSKNEENLNEAHGYLYEAVNKGLIEAKYMLIKVLKKQVELDPKKKVENERVTTILLEELIDYVNNRKTGLGIPGESKADLLSIIYELSKDEKDTDKIKSILKFSARLYEDITYGDISCGRFYLEYGKILENFGSPKEKKFASLLYLRAFLLGVYEGLEHLITFSKDKTEPVCAKIRDNLAKINRIEKNRLLSEETINILIEIICSLDHYYNLRSSPNSKAILDLRLAMVDLLVVQYYTGEDKSYNYSVLEKANNLISEIDSESDYQEEIEADLEDKLKERKALDEKNNSGQSTSKNKKRKKKKKNKAKVSEVPVVNEQKKSPEKTAPKSKQPQQTAPKSKQPQQTVTKPKQPQQTASKPKQSQQTVNQKKQQPKNKKKQTQAQTTNPQQSSKKSRNKNRNKNRKESVKTTNKDIADESIMGVKKGDISPSENSEQIISVSTPKEEINLTQFEDVKNPKETIHERNQDPANVLSDFEAAVKEIEEDTSKDDEDEETLSVTNPLEGIDSKNGGKDEEKHMEKSKDSEESEEKVEQNIGGSKDHELEVVKTIQLSDDIKFFLNQISEKYGLPVSLVGGQVRDRIRYSEKYGLKGEALEAELANHDIDIALPLPNVKLGEVIYIAHGIPFQKKESNDKRIIYANKEKNIQICFSRLLNKDLKSLVKDAKERDFTMNALYAFYDGGKYAKVYDPTGRGISDLRAEKPQTVTPLPLDMASMALDPPRILRLFDLYVKGFKQTYPLNDLWKIYHLLYRTKKTISKFYYRLDKHFMSGHAVASFDLFKKYRFIQYIFPKISTEGFSLLHEELLGVDKRVKNRDRLSQPRIYMFVLAARIFSEINNNMLKIDQIDQKMIIKLMNEYRFPEKLQNKIIKFTSDKAESPVEFIKQRIKKFNRKDLKTSHLPKKIVPVSPHFFGGNSAPQRRKRVPLEQIPKFQQQHQSMQISPKLPQQQPMHISPQYPQQPMQISPQYPQQPMQISPQYPQQPMQISPQYPQQSMHISPQFPQQPMQISPQFPAHRGSVLQHCTGQQEYYYNVREETLPSQLLSQEFVQSMPPAPTQRTSTLRALPQQGFPQQQPMQISPHLLPGYYIPVQMPYDQHNIIHQVQYPVQPSDQYRAYSPYISRRNDAASLQIPCTMFQNQESARNQREASSTHEIKQQPNNQLG